MLRPAPWPSFAAEHTSTARSSIVEPPLSATTAPSSGCVMQGPDDGASEFSAKEIARKVCTSTTYNRIVEPPPSVSAALRSTVIPYSNLSLVPFTLENFGYLLHCSWTDQLSVTWDPGMLQLVLWSTFKRKVTLVNSLCPLELLSTACIVLDTIPPWRRGGFSPGNLVCNYLLTALMMFEVTQWKSALPLVFWLYAWETSAGHDYLYHVVVMHSHGESLSTPEILLTV